jgi:hypothetical protein
VQRANAWTQLPTVGATRQSPRRLRAGSQPSWRRSWSVRRPAATGRQCLRSAVAVAAGKGAPRQPQSLPQCAGCQVAVALGHRKAQLRLKQCCLTPRSSADAARLVALPAQPPWFIIGRAGKALSPVARLSSNVRPHSPRSWWPASLTLCTRAVNIAARAYQELQVQRHPSPLRG